MGRKHLCMLSAALGAAVLFCPLPAQALDFSSTVDRAVNLDAEVSDLARAVALAQTAWRRALELASLTKIEVKTGDLTVGLATDPAAPAWMSEARPSVVATSPRGVVWTVGGPVSAQPDQWRAEPEVGGTVPVVGGTSGISPGREEAAALRKAKEALEVRKLAVERTIVDLLRGAGKARSTAEKADRQVLMAQADWERAKTVDGAAPGGTAWATRERAARLAARERRLAESEVRKFRQELALWTGIDPDEPISLPEPPPAAQRPLPSADQCLPVARALESQRVLLEAQAQEGQTTRLAARWGLGYGWSSAGDPPGTKARTGLELGLPGWQIDAGVTWSASRGTSLTLSALWSPPSSAVEQGDSAARALLREGAEAAVAQAREQAARNLADLEVRRKELRAADEEVAQDLAYAESQRALYRIWTEKGLVTAADLAEVETALKEAQNEVDACRLDWQAWDLDRRTLCGNEERNSL